MPAHVSLAHDRARLGTLLNRLVRVAIDAARGYRLAAAHANARDLAAWLRDEADVRERHALDLQMEVEGLREAPVSSGSILGDLHRTWLSLDAPYDGAAHDGALVDACLEGDGHALAIYEDVLTKGAWHGRGSAHALVGAQRDEVRRASEHLVKRRDPLAP